MPRATVERKIYFFRADIGKDDSGMPSLFDPTPALQKIIQLPFTGEDGGRYEDDADGNVLCLFRALTRANQVQFCRIRRTGLPQIEDSGNLSELQIGPNTGLSEAIQVMFFSENITGIVYNHFGPRLSRLGPYLHTKSNCIIPVVRFRPLLNVNVSKQLDELDDLRLFELNVRPSFANVIRQHDDSIGDILDANIRYQGSDDIVHVMTKHSGARRQTMLDRAVNLAKRLLLLDDLSGNVDRFRLRGKRRDTGKVETIDLLRDQLLSTQSIVRLSERGRALDPESAFQAINTAYEDLKDDLGQAYSVSP